MYPCLSRLDKTGPQLGGKERGGGGGGGCVRLASIRLYQLQRVWKRDKRVLASFSLQLVPDMALTACLCCISCRHGVSFRQL